MERNLIQALAGWSHAWGFWALPTSGVSRLVPQIPESAGSVGQLFNAAPYPVSGQSSGPFNAAHIGAAGVDGMIDVRASVPGLSNTNSALDVTGSFHMRVIGRLYPGIVTTGIPLFMMGTDSSGQMYQFQGITNTNEIRLFSQIGFTPIVDLRLPVSGEYFLADVVVEITGVSTYDVSLFVNGQQASSSESGLPFIDGRTEWGTGNPPFDLLFWGWRQGQTYSFGNHLADWTSVQFPDGVPVLQRNVIADPLRTIAFTELPQPEVREQEPIIDSLERIRNITEGAF